MQSSHHHLRMEISLDPDLNLVIEDPNLVIEDPSLVIEGISSQESLTTTEIPEARKNLGTTETNVQKKDIKVKHHRGILLTIPDKRQNHNQQIEVVTVHEARHTHAPVPGDLHIVTGVGPMTHNTSHYRLILLIQKAREEMKMCRYRVYTEARAQEQLQVSRSTTSSLVKDTSGMQTGRHVATA